MRHVKSGEHLHAWRFGERGLHRRSVEEPGCQVDRCRRHAVLVVGDLAGVQRQPRPDPFLGPMCGVVLFERIRQGSRQDLRKGRLEHLGRGQNEHAVAAVLVVAIRP